LTDDQEEWIPLRQAVAEVATVYHEALKGDYYEARQSAIKTIQHRLCSGIITARCRSYGLRYYRKDGRVKALSPHKNDDPDKPLIESDFKRIPLRIWFYISNSPVVPKRKRADWVVGDFSFNFEHEFFSRERWDVVGYAVEVEVSKRGLPFSRSFQINSLFNSQMVSDIGREQRTLPQAMLDSWWSNLDDEAKELGQDDLLDLCRAAFPRHNVSRERVREIAGPRKRGPKPKRG
jgi:hypothetical protein